MIWVLIIWLHSQNSVALTTQEFASENACETALSEFKDSTRSFILNIGDGVCIQK